MIDYIYSERFWNWSWKLMDLAPKGWLVVLIIAALLRRFNLPVHRRVVAFSAYSVLMEYVSSNESIQKLFFNDVGTSPLYHIFTPFLFFFMTLVFSDYLYSGKNKKVGIVLFVSFVLIALASALWPGIKGYPDVHLWEGLKFFPTVPVGIYSTTGILLSVGYFLHLFSKLEEAYLERLPMFWVSTGFLIYYSGNFLIWIAISFLTYEKVFFNSIYQINGYLTLLLHCFLIGALILNPKNDTPKQLTTES